MEELLIVCGGPGAGKSTYARRLASERKAVLLEVDTVTERLVQLALSESGRSPDDRDSEYFKKTFRRPLYETLFDIARENLFWTDVVVVGPFTHEIRNPSWPAELKASLGSAVEVHYVFCEQYIRKQRLLRRDNPRDVAKLKDWENFLDYYGDESPPVFPHVFIDTSDTDELSM